MRRKQFEEELLKLAEGESVMIKFIGGKDQAVRSVMYRINKKYKTNFICEITDHKSVYKITKCEGGLNESLSRRA